MPATRHQLDRRVRRLDLLRRAGSADLDAQARAALTEMWTVGHQPSSIEIRSVFIARQHRLKGELSDDHLPPDSDKPPLARLPSPRGLALRVELIALFTAQCLAAAGRRIWNMPIDPKDGDALGWRHLVLGPSTANAETRAATPRTNRIRQIKSAFDRLAEPEIGLVELPYASAPRRKYEHIGLLNEGGVKPTGPAAAYQLPRPGTPTVAVPAAFFLNGWVHVLDDTEIAAWLMFRHRIATGQTTLPAYDRIAWYGLPYPTWAKHAQLAAYGLMTHIADINRRDDGTIEDRDAHGDGALHRFFMTDEGLNKVAIDVVHAALQP